MKWKNIIQLSLDEDDHLLFPFLNQENPLNQSIDRSTMQALDWAFTLQ